MKFYSAEISSFWESDELRPTLQLLFVGLVLMRNAVCWQKHADCCSQPSLTPSSQLHSVLITSHLDVSRGQTVWDDSAADGAVRGYLTFPEDSDR